MTVPPGMYGLELTPPGAEVRVNTKSSPARSMRSTFVSSRISTCDGSRSRRAFGNVLKPSRNVKYVATFGKSARIWKASPALIGALNGPAKPIVSESISTHSSE